MFKIFQKKAPPKQSSLPEPHTPNGEVKEAERLQDRAMESIQACIHGARVTKRTAQRLVKTIDDVSLPLATAKK